MHGTKDNIIPFYHSRHLVTNVPNLYEFWPVIGANHWNVEMRDEYYVKLE